MSDVTKLQSHKMQHPHVTVKPLLSFIAPHGDIFSLRCQVELQDRWWNLVSAAVPHYVQILKIPSSLADDSVQDLHLRHFNFRYFCFGVVFDLFYVGSS